MTTQPFNPPPEDVPRILDDLASPECSLREIAEAYDTTIDGLTLWLARPDIAERFAAAEAFAARRVRHAATCQLPAAVRAATNILHLFNHAAERGRLKQIVPGSAADPAAAELRLICETARKAGSLLARIARFENGPARPRLTTPTNHSTPPPEAAPGSPSRFIAAPALNPEPATASLLCALSDFATNSSQTTAPPSGFAPGPFLPTAPPGPAAAPETEIPTASHHGSLRPVARNPSEPASVARKNANPSATSVLLHAGAPPRPP